MAYATIDDLREYAKGGEKFLVHFSDPDNQTRDDALLNQRLAAASGQMDTFFGVMGDTPLPVETLSENIVAWLTEICCLLVLQDVESYKERAQAALDWLRDFASGKIILDGLRDTGWYDKPETSPDSYDQWAEIETAYAPVFSELRRVF